MSETRLPHVKDAIGASATVASHDDHPRGAEGIASRREQQHGFRCSQPGPGRTSNRPDATRPPFLPSSQGSDTECDDRTRTTASSSKPKPGAVAATSMNDRRSPAPFWLQTNTVHYGWTPALLLERVDRKTNLDPFVPRTRQTRSSRTDRQTPCSARADRRRIAEDGTPPSSLFSFERCRQPASDRINNLLYAY